MAKKTILVADDDPHILELLSYNLEQAGFLVATASDGEAALQSVKSRYPTLIVLDMLMPGMRGDALCRTLKSRPATAGIPIIILSAIDDEADKILALESGADDYITKPFSVLELIARVKALLRRTLPPNQRRPELVSDGLRIDSDTCEATLYGEPMTLTRKEFELLRALVESEGRILSRDLLLTNIWGYDISGETRTVDVHIRHLRQKLGDCADRIQTIRNLGYRYVGSEPPRFGP